LLIGKNNIKILFSKKKQLNIKYYFNIYSVKQTPSVTTRQSVVVNKQETVISRTNDSNAVFQSSSPPVYSNLTDKEELYARLANGDIGQSEYNDDNDTYTTETGDIVENGDIAQLRAQINPSDVELLYARLPNDVLPATDNQEPLNEDQQQLHARIIGNELEHQGYSVDNNENGE